MNAWSNIEVSSHDAEISEINQLEEALGKYPAHVRQIRELITRFEVCHFKYQEHYKKIKESIKDLHPHSDPGQIGQNHMQQGEKAWENYKTGRSLMGQQYLLALHSWLHDFKVEKPSEHYNEQIGHEVKSLLGHKDPDKERLVRLLIARLTWNWKSLEELIQKSVEEISQTEEKEGLEYQICRMDICHFAFPEHLINILRGIGTMSPVDKFEGCGTYNSSVIKYIEAEFLKLHEWLRSKQVKRYTDHEQNSLIKIWLFACLAKTIKEQVGLAEEVPVLADN